MSDEANTTPDDVPATSPVMPGELPPAAAQAMPSEKPPTQTFSPEGTDFTSVANRQKSARDRLASLPEHPPFQMFIESAEPNQAGINSVQYAAERGVAAIGRMGEDAFIASYIAWWEDKGYWKGEDPFGAVTPETPA